MIRIYRQLHEFQAHHSSLGGDFFCEAYQPELITDRAEMRCLLFQNLRLGFQGVKELVVGALETDFDDSGNHRSPCRLAASPMGSAEEYLLRLQHIGRL